MIIRNVNIPDFKTFEIRKGVDIFVHEGRIEKIAREEEGFLEIPVDETVIDGKGMTAVPGMVNTHSHTAMTLLRGCAEDMKAQDWFNKRIWIYERGLKPRDIYVGTMIGAAEMLLNGVTAVADHYFHMEEAFKAYEESGMRADLAWALFGVGDDVEVNYRRAAEFVSACKDREERINLSLGPHSPYLCPDDFLKRIVADSERLGMKLHIHVAEEERQVEISLKEKGKTPIQDLYDLGVLQDAGNSPGTILAHAYWATDPDLELMARCGAGVAHCPKTYARFGDFHDFLPRACERGVKVGLGSDGPASNSTINMAETARLAAMIAKGTTSDAEKGRLGEVLPLLFGGEVLGLPRYGSLEAGAPADVVLLDLSTPAMIPGNNLFADILYGLDGRNIHTVIVDGKAVVKEGKLLTIDLPALAAEASEIAARLLATEADAPMQTY